MTSVEKDHKPDHQQQQGKKCKKAEDLTSVLESSGKIMNKFQGL